MIERSSVSGQGKHGLSIPVLPLSSLVGFMLAVAAVLVVAFFSYQSLQARSSAADQVTRTLKIKAGLEAFLSDLTDAESSQRGFLLTGEERYLDPYTRAQAELSGRISFLRALLVDPEQVQRLAAAEELTADKLKELEETIRLRRSGNQSAANAIVQSDRGKVTMDRLRQLVAEMDRHAQVQLAQRQAAWTEASESSVLVTGVGSTILLLLIVAAAVLASRDYRHRETQVWLRTGQMGFGSRIQGDQRLDVLGEKALEFLAGYLDAQIGAAYVMESGGKLRHVAGYAMADTDTVKMGHGLLGQAAKENRVLHVEDIPADYWSINSSLGRSQPRELLIAPASIDGVVQGAIELGFLRKIQEEDRELLARLSETLGVALRASKDRTRLEELLEETQRQSEELQTQQEELRTSNEELEVQARALKESKGQLESQQAELEQINSQLEEQTQILEFQKTELSKGQAILEQKADDLNKANQYKSEFLANMSHELRTPLNSSLILAKLLADNKAGNLSEEQVKFATTIQSAGNDLLAIINDVLDLSKIEAGKVDLRIEPVSVARSAQALQEGFQSVAEQKGLALDIQIDSGVPDKIETDDHRLAQILKNLLANAIKFTERGRIGLRIFRDEKSRICFAVSDTGIGIPAEQQGIIFEAFRQADGSTHRRFGGTGLGLSISRDLAHLLGGEIEVQSRPSEGSVFTLRIPAAYRGASEARNILASSHASAQFSPLRTELTELGRAPKSKDSAAIPKPQIEDDRDQLAPDSRTVLVIEDDVRFAAILRDLAHERGYQCIITHSANDGLAAARKWRPKAILLDINLPDHSGLGVLDQLKRISETRHIPVHVASVADFSQEALGLGAVGYALKPVKREELVEAFKKMESKLSQGLKHVLIVEDDERQLDSIRQLLANDDISISGVRSATEALAQLQASTFDCMVMDLNLPDLSGISLLQKMADEDSVSFPPVIVYTGRSLSRDEEQQLRRFSKSIIIKDARSPERLLDEVTLFLHQVEDKLPEERQRMLRAARDRESVFDGRRILVVEDDVRNIFALTSLLEPKGARIEIARNGLEAIEKLERMTANDAIDLVLMDIMMPEMDGFTAMRAIRKRPEWKKMPIIALTAKAMRDDQEKCLAAGANDYIAKPLDVEKLLSLIRVWLPK